MQNEIIKVKVTFPFPGLDLRKQIPPTRQGKDFLFVVNPPDDDGQVYDYWVVYEGIARSIERTTLKNKNSAIFITGEPPSVKKYSSVFLKQFDLVVTSHKGINHPQVYNYQQSLPWTLKKTYEELKAIDLLPKTKFMSIITSNKTITDGHKKRLEFALKLQSLYPGQIDLFGRGINDFDDKWETLAPYKYHVCIENSVFPDYFTEKITDSFLGLCFPLYHGCSNIDNYFDSRSLLKIDIADMENCRKVIGRLSQDDTHYEKHLAFLREARNECLDKYNLFPFIEQLVKERMQQNSAKQASPYRKVLIQGPKDMIKTQIRRLIKSRH